VLQVGPYVVTVLEADARRVLTVRITPPATDTARRAPLS